VVGFVSKGESGEWGIGCSRENWESGGVVSHLLYGVERRDKLFGFIKKRKKLSKSDSIFNFSRVYFIMVIIIKYNHHHHVYVGYK